MNRLIAVKAIMEMYDVYVKSRFMSTIVISVQTGKIMILTHLYCISEDFLFAAEVSLKGRLPSRLLFGASGWVNQAPL
jgi:hypothetical protein